MTNLSRNKLIDTIFIVLLLFLPNIIFSESHNNEEVSLELSQNEISTEDSEKHDQAILNRIENIYSNLYYLNNLSVDVDAGIVTLSGTVPTSKSHETAINFASRVDGVVSVIDQIELDTSIKSRMAFLSSKINEMSAVIITNLPIYLVALLVFLLFLFLSSVVARQNYIFKKFTNNKFLQTLLSQITRGIIVLIGFILTLELLDATALLGTILGAAGILGLAIGFAIRDTVENYIASILLSLRQPFSPSDHIVIEDYEGKIVKLTSRDTIIMTLDGNHVRIPNATVYKGIITNYTRNSLRRFCFEVGVDTAVNLRDAQLLAVNTLENTPGVISEPMPKCSVKELGDSNVVLSLCAWTDQDQYDFVKVSSEAIRLIKEEFDCANFEMPEPIYRLKIQGDNGILHLDEEISGESTNKSVSVTRASSSNKIEYDVAKDTSLDQQINRDKLNDNEPDLLED